MDQTIDISGCGTALVTPFHQDGSLDLDSYRRLIEWQIESGIDFLVPCGTTGESVTLTEEEYREVIGACVAGSGGRVPVVAGAGSNNTHHAIELAKIALGEGADALLSVTPYYNKPTQEGLFRHFEAIAGSVKAPIILYNVPGRTSVNMLAETQIRLAREGLAVGVKEASGDLAQIMAVISQRPPHFAVLSGDDPLALALVAMGGEGVISVASNLIPAEMTQLVRLARQGELSEAREIHYRFLKLMHLNFVETNPAPVKYALSRMGRIQESYRLPLCSLRDESKKKIDSEIESLGL